MIWSIKTPKINDQLFLNVDMWFYGAYVGFVKYGQGYTVRIPMNIEL